MTKSKTRARPALAAALLAALGLAACGGAGGQTAAAGDLPERYVLPGDRVFPEGIGAQKETGDFFVGSTTDGTIYRGNVRREPMEVFLPGGRDGRTAATGVRVRDGRLWVAGRFTGRVFVYDLASKRLLRTFEAPGGGPSFSPRPERSLINDITFTKEAAYVTDSFRPVVYRVSTEGGRLGGMEAWLDLRGTPIRYRRGFNLNGITVSDDERHLVTVNFDTGELFRIDARTKRVRPIDLGGANVRTGDGLLLDGTTLLVVREEPGDITPVRLSGDLLSGEIGPGFGRSQLRFPTTMFELNGRGVVVNSQLDTPDAPELPFTVSSVPIPPDTLPRR